MLQTTNKLYYGILVNDKAPRHSQTLCEGKIETGLPNIWTVNLYDYMVSWRSILGPTQWQPIPWIYQLWNVDENGHMGLSEKG